MRRGHDVDRRGRRASVARTHAVAVDVDARSRARISASSTALEVVGAARRARTRRRRSSPRRQERAGLDAVGDDLVIDAAERVGTPSISITDVARAADPRAHLDERVGEVDDLGLARGVLDARACRRPAPPPSARSRSRRPTASRRSRGRRASVLRVRVGVAALDARCVRRGASCRRGGCRRARADRAAAGLRHVRAPEAREQRSEHEERRAHSAHQLVGSFARAANAAQSMTISPGAGRSTRRTEALEQVQRRADVGDVGNVAQLARLVGEQDANSSGSAAFLAPLASTSPVEAAPPSMTSLSTSLFFTGPHRRSCGCCQERIAGRRATTTRSRPARSRSTAHVLVAAAREPSAHARPACRPRPSASRRAPGASGTVDDASARHVHAVGPDYQRPARLPVPHLGRQRRDLVAVDVRRVRLTITSKSSSPASAANRSPQTKLDALGDAVPSGVARRHLERRRRHVGGDDDAPRQLLGERDRDRARAGADVEKPLGAQRHRAPSASPSAPPATFGPSGLRLHLRPPARSRNA